MAHERISISHLPEMATDGSAAPTAAHSCGAGQRAAPYPDITYAGSQAAPNLPPAQAQRAAIPQTYEPLPRRT